MEPMTADHPEWPPDEDGFEWRLVTHTCPSCSKPFELHEQRPEWLEPTRDEQGRWVAFGGVVVECPHCSSKFVLGGAAKPEGAHLECVECHRTFAPDAVTVDAKGNWKCEGCGTSQRQVNAAETAEGKQTAGVAK